MALNPANIKYLAFEGGGGKGASYLGAIHALEKLKIITYTNGKLNVDVTENGNGTKTVDIPNGGIRGISGASAGAITAILVGCGYTAEKIKEIFWNTNFNSFFDMPFYVRDNASGSNPLNDHFKFDIDPNILNINPDDLFNGRKRTPLEKSNINIDKKLRRLFGTLPPAKNFYQKNRSNDLNIKGNELKPGHESNWNLWKTQIDEITGFLNVGNETEFLKLFYEKIDLFCGNKVKNLETVANALFSSFLGALRLVPKVNLVIPLLSSFNPVNILTNMIRNTIEENKEIDDITKKNLQDFFENYINSLYLDFGIFSGTAIHEKFNDWIKAKMAVPKDWITFKEFNEEFGVDIRFVSVNITSGSVEVFSVETTPNFCVATAARMSSGLPGIFKPILIDETATYTDQNGTIKELFPDDPTRPGGNMPDTVIGQDADGIDIIRPKNMWKGYWVDGGFFDNAPVRVWGTHINEAILLRLGPRRLHQEITNFVSFLKALGGSVGNMGSGQVNETNYSLMDHVIELNVAGATTLKFDYTKTDSKGTKTFDPDIVAIWEKNFIIVKTKFEQSAITAAPGIFSNTITPTP